MEQQTKNPTHKKIHSCKPLKPTQNQSLKESIFFSTPRRNSILFSSTLRCFSFFATALQPTTDKHLSKTMQDANQPLLDTDEEARTGNSGFKKLAVQWLNEVQFSNQTFVQVDSFVLRNRQLLKPTKR